MTYKAGPTLRRASIRKAVLSGIALGLVLFLATSCAQKPIERAGAITLQGAPLTLIGPELKVGQKAPDFTLKAPVEYVESVPGAEQVKLSDSPGKVRLISVVPSLDTPVCDLQTQRFEEEASKYKDVIFYTISMDLPFAQARYCGAQKIKELRVLSDYRDASFGSAYGVLIKELRLDTRAIFIVGSDDTIKYVEYVKEISQHPDYDSAFKALQGLAGAPSAGTSAGIKAADLAPDFQLDNLEGVSVSLRDFRGKPVLLNFWATWCPHCRAERPLIQEIYDGWRERGLVVLTVDLIGTGKDETPDNLKNFMQVNNYSFPVLLDTGGEIRKKYDITATPTNFLIDADGIIREKVIGPFPSKAQMEASLNSLMPRT